MKRKFIRILAIASLISAYHPLFSQAGGGNEAPRPRPLSEILRDSVRNLRPQGAGNTPDIRVLQSATETPLAPLNEPDLKINPADVGAAPQVLNPIAGGPAAISVEPSAIKDAAALPLAHSDAPLAPKILTQGQATQDHGRAPSSHDMGVTPDRISQAVKPYSDDVSRFDGTETAGPLRSADGAASQANTILDSVGRGPGSALASGVREDVPSGPAKTDAAAGQTAPNLAPHGSEAPASAKPVIPAPNPATPADAAVAKPTILVVDDEEMLLSLTATALERAGYTVIPVADSLKGLGLFKEHPEIVMVLSDFHMPNMDGLEFCIAAKACRPGVPFGLHSGKVAHEPDSLAQLKEHGITHLLQKPYTFGVLINYVNIIRGLPHDPIDEKSPILDLTK